MQQPIWNFEQEPYDEAPDESGVNLRAYLDRISDDKLQQYRPEWTDEDLVAWDGNFRDDGVLMLICSERDVEVEEFRRELEASIRYRNRVRSTLTQ